VEPAPLPPPPPGATVEDVPKRPRWGLLALAAFIGLVACTNIANGVWAGWIDDHPARVLALSSRQRYLVFAVSSGIGVVPYAVVASVRIAVAFVVCHLIGRAYRDDVLRVFTRYLGLTPEAIEVYRNGLDKAEIFMIPFFVGSNIVAALTGIHRTAPRRLALLLGIGIAGRLALMWWLAKAFEEPLKDVLRWVDRYDRWVILVSILLVIVINVRNFRKGSAS
jgi:hypothetical protein